MRIPKIVPENKKKPLNPGDYHPDESESKAKKHWQQPKI